MTPPDLALRLLTSSVSLVSTIVYLRKRDKQEQQRRAIADRLNQAIRGVR